MSVTATTAVPCDPATVVSCLNAIFSDCNASTPNATCEPANASSITSTVRIGLVVIAVCGVLAMFSNAIILLASKFASGGRSSTLVFIRSLCVADMMVGMFGVFKAMHLTWGANMHINCFLSESVFLTASTASTLSLLSLNIDCCVKLLYPLNYALHMDKQNVIAIIVILWNGSFISGFLPQIGWRGVDYVCQFFLYFDSSYLLSIGLLWICGVMSCIFIQIHIHTKLKTRSLHNGALSRDSLEYKRYKLLIVTTRIDLGIWILCYVPAFVYIGLYCNGCTLFNGKVETDINLLFFVPLFLMKAFCSSIVHGYKTVQIFNVISRISRRMTKVVRTQRRKQASDYAVSSLSESVDRNPYASRLTLNSFVSTDSFPPSSNSSPRIVGYLDTEKRVNLPLPGENLTLLTDESSPRISKLTGNPRGNLVRTFPGNFAGNSFDQLRIIPDTERMSLRNKFDQLRVIPDIHVTRSSRSGEDDDSFNRQNSAVGVTNATAMLSSSEIFAPRQLVKKGARPKEVKFEDVISITRL